MENETFTTISPYQSAIKPWQKQMLTLSLSVIILIALVGNLIVVVVFCTHKPLRKFTNSFLVSLAVSDMVVGAVNMPIWIVNIVCDCNYYEVLRDVWICMDIVAGVASIHNLAAVTVCRYIKITKPYTYKDTLTKGRVLGSILAIWIFSGIMALLKGLIPRNTDIWYYRPGYQLLVFSTSFVIPLAGISYCYIHMFKEATRQQHQHPQLQSQQRGQLASDIKAIKTIAIVVIVFVICWCPFFVIVIVNGFCKCVTNEHMITFVKILHYTNSALNPVIYVWYNRQYRKAFICALMKFANQHDAEFVVAFLNNKAKVEVRQLNGMR